MLTSLLTIGIGLAALLAGISGAWSPCGFAMIETFTPHMCGGRRRRNLGVALFAGGAILASAALGAILGLAGDGLPTRWTLVLLGALALLGAARDLGIHRNTLRHRIGVASRVLGADLNDPDVASRLWLALRAAGLA